MNNLRRLAAIWCLAALCCGEVAHAHVMIGYVRTIVSDPGQAVWAQERRNIRLVENIIRSTGGTYKTFRNDRITTEMFRQGVAYYEKTQGAATYNPAGKSEVFDGTVWIGPRTQLSVFTGQVRTDSLTLMSVQGASSRPERAAPSLFIRDNTQSGINGGDQYGEGVDSVGFGPTVNGPAMTAYRLGTTTPFLTHAYTESVTGGYDTGDKRVLLYGRTAPAFFRNSTNADGGEVACQWCDSLASYAASDSVLLWDRQYNTRLGQASTITFVSAFGPGALSDSLLNDGTTNYNPPCEGDFTLILAGLAHLDSLVRADTLANGDRRGGRVLGDKVIRIAPVVYGGLARGERHSWKSPGGAQGILDADTSSFYAILDSLNALNIPITFAVNPDSAGSYERDIIKMKSVRAARFTPQVWNGIADSSEAGGQNAKYRPVDVFGRWRPRVALGDLSGLGADSSMASLLKSSLRMTDSIFGRNRVSRIAVAPDDDWSPENLRIPASGFANLTLDSVLIAIQAAGFRGVVADGQDFDARATKNHGPSANNPRGYLGHQQKTKVRGEPFSILAHSGYNIMGGRSQSYTLSDSAAPYGNGQGHQISIELARIWTGALLEFDNSYDTFQYDGFATNGDMFNYLNIQKRRAEFDATQKGRPAVKANVYRLSCADLSGKPGGPPAAIGWHVLKSAKNAVDTINALAGRTVVVFSYPDDIEP